MNSMECYGDEQTGWHISTLSIHDGRQTVQVALRHKYDANDSSKEVEQVVGF